MKALILILHITVSVILLLLILLQTSKGGLGSAFGEVGFYRTKRGAERVVFAATLLAAFLFLVTSIANLVVR